MNFSRTFTLTILLIACWAIPVRRGICKEHQQSVLILWWNVENLFDTKNDPGVDD